LRFPPNFEHDDAQSAMIPLHSPQAYAIRPRFTLIWHVACSLDKSGNDLHQLVMFAISFLHPGEGRFALKNSESSASCFKIQLNRPIKAGYAGRLFAVYRLICFTLLEKRKASLPSKICLLAESTNKSVLVDRWLV
jgi:hypothetical protein